METPTFRITINKIIEEFDYEYHSVSSLQKILEKIEVLPQEEKVKYESRIAVIRKIIQDFGKENKRLTDTQVNRVLDGLRFSLLFETKPVVVVHTFHSLIQNIINRFECECLTMESLQLIIDKLDELPFNEKSKHLTEISEIISVIVEINYENKEQTKKLFDVLRKSISKPIVLLTRPTFISLIIDTIKQYHDECLTVGILQNFLRQLDSLPSAEKAKEEVHIRNAIKWYGTDESVVLTREETQKILNVFRKCIPNTFYGVILEIIDDFFLLIPRTIVERLDSLPLEEKERHKEDIVIIKCTIDNCTNESAILDLLQNMAFPNRKKIKLPPIKTFHSVLRKIIADFKLIESETIIKLLDDLPSEEKNQHESDIAAIKNALDTYKNDEMIFDLLQDIAFPGRKTFGLPTVFSATFTSVVKEGIRSLDMKYVSVGTLQSITEKINGLPQEEKDKYENPIVLIKEKIRQATNFATNVNTEITAYRILDIRSSLNQALLYEPAIPTNTFHGLINGVIKVFHDEYDTVGSLDRIIAKIEALPQEQQTKYDERITKIKSTIKGYGEFKDRTLSSKQTNRILKVLREAVPVPSNVIDHNKLLNSNYSGHSIQRFSPLSQLNTTNYNTTPYLTLEKKVVKFDTNDQIFQVVFTLLTDLSSFTLSSTLTTYVQTYYVLVNILLEDNFYKYKDITDEIEGCLQKYGWKCKDSKSEGGFQTIPNQEDLVKDLKKITDKYF